MATRRKDHYEHRHRKDPVKSRRARAVGKVLQERREKLGISMSDLARRCGWDAARIWKYETGHAMPGLDAMACLCRELKMSLQKLIAIANGDLKEVGHAAVAAGAA